MSDFDNVSILLLVVSIFDMFGCFLIGYKYGKKKQKSLIRSSSEDSFNAKQGVKSGA